MEIHVMQEQINRLSGAMLAKGLRSPSASFDMSSHEEPSIVLRWEKPKKRTYELGDYHYIRGGTHGEMLAKADAFIATMPTAKEAKFNEFMGALGGVIDLGKENGIEVEFLNPLVATMKQLSENALTDQRQPAQ